jgi:hypothetical protein
VKVLGIVIGPCGDFRQVCLYKYDNRRECLSLTVRAKVKTQVSRSLKRGYLGPGHQDMHETASGRPQHARGSGQRPVHQRSTRSVASAYST